MFVPDSLSAPELHQLGTELWQLLRLEFGSLRRSVLGRHPVSGIATVISMSVTELFAAVVEVSLQCFRNCSFQAIRLKTWC